MPDALIGDETGLLKRVAAWSGAVTRYQGEQSRKRGIVSMYSLKSLYSTSETLDKAIVVLLRIDGSVETWKVGDSDELEVFSSVTVEFEVAGLLNLDLSSCVALQSNKSINVAYSSILVYGKAGEVEIIGIDEAGNLIGRGSNDKKIRDSLKGPVSCGAACRGGFLLGGRENDLRMYDTTTLLPIWEAKNVPHDKLKLRVPIWVTDVAFIRPEECSISTGANIVTGTGYKQVRLYDTRVSRQPVTSIDVSEDYRVTKICPTIDGNDLYVGDTSGGLYLWDLRMKLRKNTLKGGAGSIRDIALSSDGDFVAAVGLDRYLRVYSYNGSAFDLESSTYLKNRLNCCLIFDAKESDEDGYKQRKSKNADRYDNDDDVVEDYEDSSEDDEEIGNDDDDEDDGSKEGSDDQGDENDDEEEDDDEEVDEIIIPSKKSASNTYKTSNKKLRR